MTTKPDQETILKSAAYNLGRAKADAVEAAKVEGPERKAMVAAAIVRAEKAVAALKGLA